MRLAAVEVGETDWLAFDDWVHGEPGGLSELRRAAFDEAQALWLALDGAADAGSEPNVLPVRPRRSRPRSSSSARTWRAAAVVVGPSLLVGIAAIIVASHKPVSSVTYATGVGGRRSVRLPDGTRIDLNAASRLTVAYAGASRQVGLDQGEALFDVAHDASRPFVIRVGQDEVRVLGTAFDVWRYEGETRVSVSRGVVQFATPRQTVQLTPGLSVEHRDGAPLVVEPVERSAVGLWRDGRLVYHDQPLSAVAADLNRQFTLPIRFGDRGAAQLRFTGVLVMGREHDVVRRLSSLLPVRVRVDAREVVLSLRNP